VGQDFSSVFIGQATLDIQYLLESDTPRDGKQLASNFSIAPGGQALNAAIAFSALGGRAALVAPIGVGFFNQFLLQDLINNRVDVFDVCHDTPSCLPVSSIFSYSHSGCRSIVTSPYEFDQYKKFEVPRRFIDNFKLCLVDSNYPVFVTHILRLMDADRPTVVFDAEVWSSSTLDLLKFVDIAICSEDFRPNSCASSCDVVDFLHSNGVKYVAISRGEMPIIVSDGLRTEEIPVDRISALDTLAAGDFFHGAFCYFYLQTNDFKASIKMASKMATWTCGFFGTRDWIKHLK